MRPSLTRHKAWANAFMLAVAILFFAQQAYLALLRMGFGRHVVKPYYISGWLINYRGGFVRRGLPGECLLRLYEEWGIEPQGIILVLSSVCFLVLVATLARQLFKKGYCWWFLPMTFSLGGLVPESTDSVILALAAVALPVVHLGIWNNLVRWAVFSLVSVVMVLIHEVSFFLCAPYFSLVLMEDRRLPMKPFMRPLFLLPMAVAFLGASLFQGAPETALAIERSWAGLDGTSFWQGAGLIGVNAISWRAANLSRLVWSVKFGGVQLGVPNQVWLVICLAAVMMVMVVVPCLWRKKRQGVFFSMLAFQFACLLPVMPFFSDVSRLCGMWTTTAVAFAVFFKPSPLLSRVACAIRGWSWALPVTVHRTVVCLAALALMFLLGFNRSGFDLVRSFRKSGVMRILAIPEYFK